MTAQPEALRLAEHLDAVDDHVLKSGTLKPCAALLRAQHAEIEASDRNLCQLTDELAECRREIGRKDALLRQARLHVASNIAMNSGDSKAEDLYDAITSELAK